MIAVTVDDLLRVAIILAVTTAGLGAWVALGFLRGRPLPGRSWAALLHGIAALTTLGAVTAVYLGSTGSGGRAPGSGLLTAAFWLLMLAAPLGLLTLATRKGSRTWRGAAMGVHASFAIFGVVVLLAYVAV